MLLMRLLEAHPDLLVLRPHRYEQRVAGYWVEVLLTLTEPSSYMRQLAPARRSPSCADGERGLADTTARAPNRWS